MTSSNDNIEKLFSDSFQDYSHELDETSAWSAIQSRLDKKKKRRFFWWIWPIGVVAFTAIAFFVLNNVSDKRNLTSEKKENKSQIELNNSTQKTNNQNNSQTQIDEQKANTSNKINNSQITLADKISKSTTKQKTKAKASNQKELQATPALSHSSTEDRPSQSALSVKEDNREETSALLTHNSRRLEDGGQSINETRMAESQIPVINENKKQASPAVNSLNLNTNTWKALTPNPLLAIDLLEKENQVFELTSLEPRLVSAEKKQNYFIEFSGGGLTHFIQTKTNSNLSEPISSNLLERTENWQDAIMGYQVELLVGRKIGRQFDLSTGIEYQNLFSKLEAEYVTRTERNTVYNPRAGFMIDDAGETIFIGDSVLSTDTYTRRVKLKQRHTLVSVPLQLGWTIKKGGFDLGIVAGPVFNVYHNFSGKSLDLVGETISTDDEAYEEEYKRQVGLSWRGGLKISRNMGLKSQLFARLNFTYDNKNWRLNNNPLATKINRVGLNLGWRQFL